MVSDAEVTTWSGRTQESKNKDLVDIKDYGAKCDGSTIDNAAVIAMFTDIGYVRFPKGISKLNTMILSGHIYFDVGASLTVASGQTLTIIADIEAPKTQTLFRGNGTYNLLSTNSSGESFENIRKIQAAWFGLYPTNDTSVDLAPLMQKISNSLGNAREGVVEFMVGNYQIHSAVTWNRGIEIRGEGTRRTVFKIHGDGYIPFTTNNVAVRFRGFQFEFDLSSMTSRNSPLLQINHDDCEIHDVGTYPSAKCIVINGINAVVKDIRVTYGTDMSTVVDSCVILVQKGGCSIDGVRGLTSTFAPQYLVLINPNSNTSNIDITNISSNMPCILVGVVTDSTFRISNINITNVKYNSSQLNNVLSVIQIKSSSTSSSATIRGVNIDNIIGNGTTQQTIFIDAQVANIDSLNIDNIIDQRTTGYLVFMTRTSGIIKDTQIGKLAAININYPVFASDNAIVYKISNLSEKYCHNPKTFFNDALANDSVFRVDIFRSVQTASVEVIANNGATLEYGNFAARFINTPAVATMNSSANIIAVFNTNLTGTTGAAGKITVAINNFQLQIENRTGVSQNIIATIKSGRW